MNSWVSAHKQNLIENAFKQCVYVLPMFIHETATSSRYNYNPNKIFYSQNNSIFTCISSKNNKPKDSRSPELTLKNHILDEKTILLQQSQ